VWVANRDSPVTTPSSAKLVITNSSELALLGSNGHFLWTNSVTSTEDAGAVAVLLNSGNLVLRSSNGTEIWQSFFFSRT
jgi:NAD-dependent oxidoreductase involved in siderophore biosynthesis